MFLNPTLGISHISACSWSFTYNRAGLKIPVKMLDVEGHEMLSPAPRTDSLTVVLLTYGSHSLLCLEISHRIIFQHPNFENACSL